MRPNTFGRDHQFVARQILDRHAQHLLGQAIGIDVRRVDEGDALIERRLHQLRATSPMLQRADDFPEAVAAKGHGAEADFRHGKARAAEFAIAHAHSPGPKRPICE
jgi:hypothetical protein